jgi:hypothetical protein
VEARGRALVSEVAQRRTGPSGHGAATHGPAGRAHPVLAYATEAAPPRAASGTLSLGVTGVRRQDRPLVSDGSAFEAAFGPFRPTPHGAALRATLAWWRGRATAPAVA